MRTNVMVVGSGGREHALLWKLAQSSSIGNLFAAPGNGGTEALAQNVQISATDIRGLIRFAKKNNIGLTVVQSDNPLALGIVDAFQANGLKIFGPTKEAAKIEWSKAYAKRLMRQADIPTAPFSIFSNHEEALRNAKHHGVPVVIKASGLAKGKGVYVCKTETAIETALRELMVDRVHGDAGREVIVEEHLEGPEISIHAFCDGKTAVLLPPSQDHKAALDGDRGANTGGMGAYAPVPWITEKMLAYAKEYITEPALAELTKCDNPFVGCLYPGLKINEQGPQVLEFNARFGDPETQVYMRLLKTDLLEILAACLEGALAKIKIEWHEGYAVCVVLASGGYPGQYETGFPIYGIELAERFPEVVIFHAGTKNSNDGGYITSGGRVLCATAFRKELTAARQLAITAAHAIYFRHKHFRTDIGAKTFAF